MATTSRITVPVQTLIQIALTIWLPGILLALLLFAIFWLQGLAVLHWLRARGQLPGILLAAVYVLMVPFGFLLVPTVGVMGYTDAWFDYRPRIARK